MNNSSDEIYTLADAKEEIGILERVTDEVVDAIQAATDEEVLEFLIESERLDVVHDGARTDIYRFVCRRIFLPQAGICSE